MHAGLTSGAVRKTTMFRRLYWVTEQVQANGASKILGVYTSIPDLIRHGLTGEGDGRLRLTLTKLDSEDGPIGTWLEPGFDNLEAKLQDFVKTEEFSAEHCKSLVRALELTSHVAA